jgi:hypothetical protein
LRDQFLKLKNRTFKSEKKFERARRHKKLFDYKFSVVSGVENQRAKISAEKSVRQRGKKAVQNVFLSCIHIASEGKSSSQIKVTKRRLEDFEN